MIRRKRGRESIAETSKCRKKKREKENTSWTLRSDESEVYVFSILYILVSLNSTQALWWSISNMNIYTCSVKVGEKGVHVLFRIKFSIRDRKGPIKMLWGSSGAPLPFVRETPPHLKEEWFHDWLRMKNTPRDSHSRARALFLWLSLPLSLSCNTYIVCRETESTEWPQKEKPHSLQGSWAGQVLRPTSLLMDGFLCELDAEASSSSYSLL